MPKHVTSHDAAGRGADDVPPPWRLLRRWQVIVAFLVILLWRLLSYGGAAWLVLVAGLVMEGLFAGYWLACGMLAGWFVLDRLGMTGGERGLARSLLLAGAAGVGLGLVGLLTLGLGLAGLLNHWTASGMLLVLALPQAIRLVRRTGNFDLARWLRDPSPAGAAWLVAAPFLGIALTGAMLPPGLLWKSADDPHPYDILEYHLQVPREWYEAGRIVPLAHNAFSYFPFGAEMHYLLAIHLRGGPWDGMYLAQLMSVVFSGLTVLAIYGTCRTLRGDDSRLIPALAAVLAAVVPWTVLLAPIAYVESALLCYGTLAIGWALAASSVRGMVVAGALAGFACGVKYTGVPMVLLAVPVAPLARGKPRLVPLAAFVVAGLVTFSPWLIRNAVWTGGNPVFPEATGLFGAGHFTPEQVERWQQAHSPRPDQRSIGARVVAAGNQVVADWRYGYVLLPLGFVSAFLAWRRPEARALLLLLLIVAGIWLLATHLQSRFFVLAIPICAILVGLVPAWRRAWVVPAVAVAVVAVPGYLELDRQLKPYLGPFGVTDFKDAMPPAYVKLAEEGRNVALVGQAQAFWYQIPMTRLTYRTVFDVRAADAADPIAPWLGRDPRPDQWLLVYPSELDRFAKTYRGIPAPPAELLRQPEPMVVPPK